MVVVVVYVPNFFNNARGTAANSIRSPPLCSSARTHNVYHPQSVPPIAESPAVTCAHPNRPRVPFVSQFVAAIRYVMMLRMLRLARLLGKIPSVSFIARTFITMLPSLSNLLKVLFCIMYLFAALGVASFGGIINTDPTNPRNDTLKQSDFGQVRA